jgi:translation elongation factor EF-Ts
VCAEGMVSCDDQVNSETDFVARNTDFQDFVKGAVASALKMNEVARSVVSQDTSTSPREGHR